MLSHRARRSDRIAQLAVILSLKTFVRLHSAANKKFKQNPFFFSLRHRWSQLLGMLQESFKVTPPSSVFGKVLIVFGDGKRLEMKANVKSTSFEANWQLASNSLLKQPDSNNYDHTAVDWLFGDETLKLPRGFTELLLPHFVVVD